MKPLLVATRNPGKLREVRRLLDGSGIVIISDKVNPINNTGIATTSPASGPAMPTSSNTRRFLIGAFIRINAPNVPNGLIIGNGRK